jgi:hypothetical protein
VPPLNRVQAHSIIAGKYSSAAIALGRLDGKSDFGVKKERQTRNHVRKFIGESFYELSRQFSYLASGSGLGKMNEELSKEYWSFSTKQINALLDSGNPIDLTLEAVGNSSDENREEFLRQDHEGSQFVIKASADGMRLMTYQPSFEGEDSDRIKIRRARDIGVQFSFGAHSLPGGAAASGRAGRGIVVDFPWAMGIDEEFAEDVRMSPAAFGILLSLCSRDFVADVDRYLGSVIKFSGSRCLGSRGLYLLSQPHLKKGGFPEGLFEAWAKYMEVGEG